MYIERERDITTCIAIAYYYIMFERARENLADALLLQRLGVGEEVLECFVM